VEAAGVVAIMHVDVEGSTALATRAGDELAHRVLDDTKRLVREHAEGGGGREIDAVGDAMMLTFVSTRAAIAAAMQIQEAIAKREEDRPDESLRVRIGINVGEVLERDGRPVGAAVNAGARVMGKADGGEILVSEMAKRLAGTTPGATYRDRGRHAFKGFDEPWRVYQVMWPGAPRARPRTRQRPSGRALAAVFVGLAVTVGGAVAAIYATRGGGPTLRALHRNTVGLIDTKTGRLVADVVVGAGPDALAAANGSLWVANGDGETVTRISERTRVATVTIPVGGHPSAIIADASGAWVAEAPNRRLVRVDAEFDRVVRTLPADAGSLALAGGYLWDTANDALERRDAESGRLLSRKVLGLGARALMTTPGTLWVGGSGFMTPYDSRRGVPVGQPIQLVGYPSSVAAASNRLWLVSTALQEIDTRSMTIAGTWPLGMTPQPLAGTQLVAATGAAAFVANTTAGTVLRVDATIGRRSTIDLGATPRALLATRAGVWVAAS
jgi:class 3 adenylate cyclase